jgi:hypothetical protein
LELDHAPGLLPGSKRERPDRPKHHEKHSDLKGVKPLLRGLGGYTRRVRSRAPTKTRQKIEKDRSPHRKRGKSLQASTITPFEARGLMSGTIIRGTLNAPNHGWLTPSDQLTGVVQAKTSSTRRTRSYPSPASGWNSGPRRIHASPEGLLRRQAPPWLSRGPARAGFVVKQPLPYRLTNRPLHRRIKCGGCLTMYPDTHASIGQAEVTAVTSPLLFTVRYDRKTALLAPLRLQCQPPRQQLTTGHDQPASSSLGRNRKLRLAQPQTPTLGGGLCLARPQTRPRPRSRGESRPRPTLASATREVSASTDPGLGLIVLIGDASFPYS